MKLVSVLFLLCIWIPCKEIHGENQGQRSTGKDYTCRVRKTEIPPEINSDWNSKAWKSARNLRISNFMGERPSHFPETKVKLLYDNRNIYVIFSVSDKYVKAVAKETNGKVWMDSCVEFFFSPGGDTERGYFNFEANCKGVFLFQYHLDNGQISGFVIREDCEEVKISHSLKQNVEQEFAEPLEWRLEYSIPFTTLKKYMKVDEPGPGVCWRANFYKCADKTSHPHWLTWAPVDYPQPKFHLPEFFGKLVFE
jgi:hypothetical protein